MTSTTATARVITVIPATIDMRTLRPMNKFAKKRVAAYRACVERH